MTTSDYALKVMLCARNIAEKGCLSFHTDDQYYTDQMLVYLKELEELVKEYNHSKSKEAA
tara:strand:- start:118 stop:297 length:180 start_codon:yes stop_codon:yes gene_type:complete